MASLEKKPESGSTPVMASVAIAEGGPGVPHLLAQAAELADVCLVAHAVHHGARAQEQAGLEEGVGHQVEDAPPRTRPRPRR